MQTIKKNTVLLLKGILLIGFLTFLIWGYKELKSFQQQDACLDAGGSWDKEKCACEYSKQTQEKEVKQKE